jgi:hypothetical protein
MGFVDSTALSVLGHDRISGRAYELQSWAAPGLTVSQIVAKVKELSDKWHPQAIVIDPSAGGKHVGLELQSRYGLPCFDAEKADKAVKMRMLDSDIVNGKFTLLPDGAAPQMRSLMWDDQNKREAEGQKCDRADATLYAWWYLHTHVTVEAPRPAVSKDSPEWAEQEFKRALRDAGRAQRQEQAEAGWL